MLSENLMILRKRFGLTQEELAERVNVSRQTIAKWENGETVPDVVNCSRLADLYHVTLDDLVNYEEGSGVPIPPKGKHIFGTVTVGERGQIALPKKAREVFHIGAGDRLVVLGDEEQGAIGILKEEGLLNFLEAVSGKEH